MRNLKYFSFGIISLIFASCIEEKNLSIQNEEDMENAELGLSTDFSLKTERSISITATDGEGKTQKGVKMGIFASQPYTGEGIISVEPIFVGYTDASGKFEKDHSRKQKIVSDRTARAGYLLLLPSVLEKPCV